MSLALQNGKPPFFSIIVPTYNRADMISATIDSCLQQTWHDFELLVIDDGSSDHTEAVVMAIDDHRIRYIKRDNGGPAAARNTGIMAARGRYLAFLDSDDRFLPEKLAHYHDRIMTSGAAVCYGPIYVDRGVGKMWIRPESGMRQDENAFDWTFLRRGFFQTSTLVVETSLARKHPFLETLWFGDNDQFGIDLWRSGAQLEYIEEPLVVYTDGYDSDRLSQAPVFAATSPMHERFFDWVESHRAEMSPAAYLAYRARFRSRLTAKSSPREAISDLIAAYRANALSGKECIRQSVQTFFPDIYRRLADLVARYRGVQMSS